MANKKARTSSTPSPNASRRLAELQKDYPLVGIERDNLRQPYRFDDRAARTDTVVETFTTYGAYQDPI